MSRPDRKYISSRSKNTSVKGRCESWFGLWQGEREGDLPLASACRIQESSSDQGEPVLSGFCRRLIVIDVVLAVFEPEAVAVHLEDVNVVGKAIEQCASKALGGEHTGPLVEGQLAGAMSESLLELSSGLIFI